MNIYTTVDSNRLMPLFRSCRRPRRQTPPRRTLATTSKRMRGFLDRHRIRALRIPAKGSPPQPTPVMRNCGADAPFTPEQGHSAELGSMETETNHGARSPAEPGGNRARCVDGGRQGDAARNEAGRGKDAPLETAPRGVKMPRWLSGAQCSTGGFVSSCFVHHGISEGSRMCSFFLAVDHN